MRGKVVLKSEVAFGVFDSNCKINFSYSLIKLRPPDPPHDTTFLKIIEG